MKHQAKGERRKELADWTKRSHIKPTDGREWNEQSPEGSVDGRSLFPDGKRVAKSGNVRPTGTGTIPALDGVVERECFRFKVVYETTKATPKGPVVHEQRECFVDTYSRDAVFAKFRREIGTMGNEGGKILSVEQVRSLGRSKFWKFHETALNATLDQRRPRKVVLDEAGFKARWKTVEKDTERLAAYYSRRYDVDKDDLMQAAQIRLSMIENGSKPALLRAAKAAIHAEVERARTMRRGESRPAKDLPEDF